MRSGTFAATTSGAGVDHVAVEGRRISCVQCLRGPSALRAQQLSLLLPGFRNPFLRKIFPWRGVLRPAPTVSSSACLLYLFSGLLGLPGGLDAAAVLRGLLVKFLDLEVDLQHDLCDDTFFASVCRDILHGLYDRGLLASPPCSTFTKVRSLGGPGYPDPLRGATGSALRAQRPHG